MKYLALLLCAVLPAFAVSPEQFKEMKFEKIVTRETAPDGSPSVVIGVSGELEGENRVAIGLVHAASGKPELRAIFYLNEENDPVVSLPSGDGEWGHQVIDGQRSDMIKGDLWDLREEVFGLRYRPTAI